MDFCFATVAALFLLFTAASCASVGLGQQDACADVQISSLKFNRVAKNVSIKARNGSKNLANFTTSPVWMEAKDLCDPGTLKQNSATCIEKILDVLASYNSAVERVAEFKSCSEFVSEVKPMMQKLDRDMRTCVKSRGEIIHKNQHHEEEIQPIAHWQEAPLCHYIMDRLFSFSILTARVFAVGDPAHHTEGSAQRCM